MIAIIAITFSASVEAADENDFRSFNVELTMRHLRATAPQIPGQKRVAPVARPELPSRSYFINQTMQRMDPERFTSNADCCPCTVAASCDDQLFCNGLEICLNGNCASGTPSCVDGDACTIDGCDESTDSCQYSPVDPPSDVDQLALSRMGSTVATLEWAPVSGADSYKVYRAADSMLSDIACFDGDVTGTSTLDDGAVPTNAFFYLITAVACSESTFGNGNPFGRPDPPVCLP